MRTTFSWRILLFAVIAALTLAAFAAGCGDSTGETLTSGGGAVTLPEPGQEDGRTDQNVASTVPEKTPFESLTYPVHQPDPARVVKLPTLMFHHVGDPPPGADEIRQGLTVSGADFEAMMAYLKQAGYHPVSEKQLFKALFKGEALPANPVMLTIDDGYDDNFSVAAPILEKYGFPATFYIITDKVGTPEYMSWDQVKSLDSRGMDIGSHTCSHADLASLGSAELELELTDSARKLESNLGHPVYWLCYPAGKYDEGVELAARRAGYLLATTTEPGEQQSSDTPYELLRYRVRSDTGLAGFQELVR